MPLPGSTPEAPEAVIRSLLYSSPSLTKLNHSRQGRAGLLYHPLISRASALSQAHLVTVPGAPLLFPMTRAVFALCAFLAIVCACVHAASTSQPHPHKGVLKPFANGPININLSGADLKREPGTTAPSRIPRSRAVLHHVHPWHALPSPAYSLTDRARTSCPRAAARCVRDGLQSLKRARW